MSITPKPPSSFGIYADHGPAGFGCIPFMLGFMNTLSMKASSKSISNSLLKIVCHILSFDNLLKDLASEKKNHLQ